MSKLEEKLTVGTQIRLGNKYCKFSGRIKGAVITLVEGEFYSENGLHGITETAPAIWDEDGEEFDSIYHLFGNDLEDFKDCEILTPVSQ